MSPSLAKGIFAICAGYGAGLWFAAKSIKQAGLFREAAWWPGTKGRILESRLDDSPGRRFEHFIIRYEFTVSQRIEGNTPRLCGGWFWSNKLQKSFIGRYPAGQAVEVYYNPHNPQQNCLDRTDRSGVAIMVIIATGSTLLATLLVWLIFHLT